MRTQTIELTTDTGLIALRDEVSHKIRVTIECLNRTDKNKNYELAKFRVNTLFWLQNKLQEINTDIARNLAEQSETMTALLLMGVRSFSRNGQVIITPQ